MVICSLQGVAYGAVAAALIPLQFLYTLNDEPRLQHYHVSLDIFHQAWALVSQLVFPIASPGPMDVLFRRIVPVEWAAGALALALCVILLLRGSARSRFLIIWAAAALSPFTLWDAAVESPRYVYMAAIPLAIGVGILTTSAMALLEPRHFRAGARAFIVLVLVVISAVGAYTTIKRNEAFQDSAIPYEILATRLKDAVPTVPHGSRIVIHNSVLNLFWIWPKVTVQTAYRDSSLSVVTVRPNSAPPEHQPGDVDVYYLAGSRSFTLKPPSP